MKKILSIVAVLALAVTVSFAQKEANDQNAKTPETNEGPVMTFETMEINYGEIEQSSDPLRIFKFTNTGTEPLIIKNAKGSCGCTVPSYPKNAILPGEAAEIEVRYDTKRLGPFTKTVTLTTNEKTEKHVLKIKGKVHPKPPEPEGVPASNSGFGNNNNN